MEELDVDELDIATLKTIHNHFGRGKFEYFHIRQQIPSYDRRIHRKLCGSGYLEVSHISGKANVWKVGAKTLKLLRVPCRQ